MPWKETNAVDQRMRFIIDYSRQEESFSSLCRRYGVSRVTGYKWVERFAKGGFEALENQRRAPHTHPNQTPAAVEELIVRVRKDHPTWGPRKIKAFVERRYPGLIVPAASTIGVILHRHRMPMGRRKRRRDRPGRQPLCHHKAPNSCWAIDFKGQFKLGSGQYCYPLTLQDVDSRFLLCCEGLTSVRGRGVIPVLTEVFREYGLPDSIRSDNGAPFASTSFTGLTELSAWWIALGIRLERTRPGNPQENGRLERMHRTLKAETTRPASKTLLGQQRAFNKFRSTYNHERPHEALDNHVPSDFYEPSSRPMPNKLPKPTYPDEAEVRKVATRGNITFQGYEMYLSGVLAGQHVGWLPKEDGTWEVHFHHQPLGVFDPRAKTFTNGVTTKKARRCGSCLRPFPSRGPSVLQSETNAEL